MVATGDVVGDAVVNASIGLIGNIGKVANWLAALGIVVALGIVFNIIMIWLNYKRFKALSKIMDDMKRIENKIDRLYKK